MHAAFRMLPLAALALTTTAGAQGARRGNNGSRIDTTFAFSKTGDVNLSLIAGEIRVTAWARDEIHVVATSEVGNISSSFSPNRVRLEMRDRSPRAGRARYEITVPIGVRVNASAVSGTINVNGTRSTLALTSVNGAITASDSKGRSEIETTAGSIGLQRFDGTTRVSGMAGEVTMSEMTGDLEIEAVNANVRIDRGDLSSLRFESLAGTLDYSGVLSGQGKHRIETLSGAIVLRFPANFGATLELETLKGELRGGDFPLTLRPANGTDRGRSSDRQEYSVNGGGAQISIETFTGSVVLKKIGAPERR